jgi:hypothetical protein
MKIIGIYHICHSFFLSIYPFICQDDIAFVNYYTMILLSYTYLNGECPVTYLYKRLRNPEYIAGTTLTSFDDVYQIAPREYVHTYACITTGCSLYNLFTILRQLETPIITIILNGIIILYYIYLSRCQHGDNRPFFLYYQWCLRTYILLSKGYLLL